MLDVGRLAADVLRPARSHAVVCVTIPSWGSEPLLDAEALADELAAAAVVYVLPTGDLSWELTDRLPPRLDVYGGAARIWWPGVGPDSNPHDHPLFFIHDRSESSRVIARIVGEFEERGLLETSAPSEGAEVPAVVTALRPWGVDLKLAGGRRAYAHRSRVTRVALPVEHVLRPGQSVRAVVLDKTDSDGRMEVALDPFEPDPWERLAEQYEAGTLVEGVVDEFRNFGAFVTLLPGARGLLHKGQISDEWVSHPEDFLELGQRLVVRIVSLDPGERKAVLSLRGVPADPAPVPVASIYPDGPPWLAPRTESVEPASVPGDPSEAPASLAAQVSPEVELGIQSEVSEEHAPPDVESDLEEAREDVQSPEAQPAIADTDELERTIEEARALEERIVSIYAGAEQRLGRLRAEAAQIRQDLQKDLAEARLRLIEFAESEISDLTGSTEAALAEARKTVEELREQLTAAETDRLELLARVKQERDRASAAEARAETLRGEGRAERERVEALRGTLEALEPDPGRRFIADVRRAWERSGTDEDRKRYPWREPRIGPEFLGSLERVQGISLERIIEVSAHVVSGRAREIPGLELHPLRTSDLGSAPQRVRDDGAKAWRCNLQASTAAARRLHYWELPDGGVELAKVVYHDDFSIR